ncbi:MAG: alcohol dehydrogenase catalytic domain-containing protein [Planctomycetes bacterium]|nr:alcohol dehydrogenase catalytic domain-containing protein [Planctomycetota bacterium]
MPISRSAYLRAPWQVELRKIELPDAPPAGHVLLAIDACGICGTDLTAAKSGAKEWSPVGHEVAGTIAALGAGCPSHLVPGMTVVLESSSFCGHCAICRNGHSDLCNRGPSFWQQPAMGIGEYMITPAIGVVPYTGLDPVIACQAEPVGVAIDLIMTAGIALGDRVCVVGPGPIGLSAAAMALRSGALRVLTIGCSRHGDRLAFARSLGSEILASDAPLDGIAALKHQFDHVLVTAPTDTIAPALALLAVGGRLTYLGIGTHDGMISFNAHDFHFRKLQLRASFASPALYLPLALDLMRQDIIPGKRMASHVFDLDRVGEAFATCADPKQGALKVVVRNRR